MAVLLTNQNISEQKQIDKLNTLSDIELDIIEQFYQDIKQEIHMLLQFSQHLINQTQFTQDEPIIQYQSPILFKQHKKQIGAIAISNDDELIASGDWSGVVIQWSLSTQERIKQFKYNSCISDIKFSYNKKLLAAANWNEPFLILLYDVYAENQTAPRIKSKVMKFIKLQNTICRNQFTLDSIEWQPHEQHAYDTDFTSDKNYNLKLYKLK